MSVPISLGTFVPHNFFIFLCQPVASGKHCIPLVKTAWKVVSVFAKHLPMNGCTYAPNFSPHSTSPFFGERLRWNINSHFGVHAPKHISALSTLFWPLKWARRSLEDDFSLRYDCGLSVPGECCPWVYCYTVTRLLWAFLFSYHCRIIYKGIVGSCDT